MMRCNNGGLCQFFVNSSSDCAPFISEALEAIGATELRNLFEQFVNDNDIDVTDLSSFKITNLKEYEAQTERFDFDSFDERFYENEDFHQQVINYYRCNVEQLLKNQAEKGLKLVDIFPTTVEVDMFPLTSKRL